MSEEFSYDKAIQEIEDIIARLESGECEMDEMFADVKKAARLVALCKKKLSDVNAEVNKLFSDISE